MPGVLHAEQSADYSPSMTIFLALSILSLVTWLYLMLFHGRFWHADQRLTDKPHDLSDWPDVCAVIPARNEEMTIRQTVRSLLDQDYPGDFLICVVNDNSDDDTVAEANAAALSKDDKKRLKVINGAPLTEGWVGKMWAVSQGLENAGSSKYVLLTDADIAHDQMSVRKLLSKAELENLGLVSEMVRLNCVSFWETLLIPPFVYFFQKLYPFPKINDPENQLAGAAGGCMLVRREDLAAAGGIERIKDKVIDDCSLAAIIKPIRPVWLGLSETTKSIRPYNDLSSIWGMVARTAYVQLRFNPLLLIGTILSLMIIYLLPVAGLIAGIAANELALMLVSALAWTIMWWTMLPTLELYGRSSVWGLLLPIAGFFYTLMTLDSARRHYQGQGGAWKGRTYTPPVES